MFSSGSASAFLIGRLTQEGRQPVATLAASVGPWRGLTGVHVFAVSDGRLWLAQPRLIGDPSLASVPLSEVGEAELRTGRRVELVLTLGGRRRRFTVLDDADAGRAFVEALRTGPVDR